MASKGSKKPQKLCNVLHELKFFFFWGMSPQSSFCVWEGVWPIKRSESTGILSPSAASKQKRTLLPFSNSAKMFSVSGLTAEPAFLLPWGSFCHLPNGTVVRPWCPWSSSAAVEGGPSDPRMLWLLGAQGWTEKQPVSPPPDLGGSVTLSTPAWETQWRGGLLPQHWPFLLSFWPRSCLCAICVPACLLH